MNYFSHYFVDHIAGRHEFNTGLLLPDITRKEISKFRELSSYNHMHHEFYLGCLAHYSADKGFHASAFFKSLNEVSLAMINEAPFSEKLNRKWFLAHILTELMIDRILVKKYPETLDDFYKSLNSVSDEQLAGFLELNGMSDITAFFENFNHFRRVQYIYYYADNNKFVYSLNRTMMRAGVGEMSEADQDTLRNVILFFEKYISEDIPKLVEQLKESKNN